MLQRRRRINKVGRRDDVPRFRLSPETKRGIVTVAVFTFAFLSILAFFDSVGPAGQAISAGLGSLFGWGAWLVPILLLTLGYYLLKPAQYELNAIKYIGLTALIVSATGLLHLIVRDKTFEDIVYGRVGGGIIGYLAGNFLFKATALPGAFIILTGVFLVGIFIFFSISFHHLLDYLRKIWSSIAQGFAKKNLRRGTDEDLATFAQSAFKTQELESREEILAEEETDEELEDINLPRRSKSSATDELPKSMSSVKKRMNKIDIPIDLLTASTETPTSGDINANIKKIETTLRSFGIEVTMGEVNVGPTVTQYTLRPMEGVKISQIATLQNDLALALAAHPIRIEAPIPGKSLVGIEVPNQTVSIVRLKEVLASSAFSTRKSNLMVALGKDVTGRVMMADLAKMPHLLIAGATGSGKSVCINSMLVSLLYQNSPEDLKIILVDPKRVELLSYDSIPHLLTPVITDVEKTINALRWTVSQMDERYKLLSAAGKRNIESYNSARLLDKMPYMVIIIDELADLMAVAAKEVESAIIRLAQMARAVGIHLILATQRPSVNVITGLIKANITSRIAFSVASLIDSRTILDSSGAEKLLGNGDMLFTSAELTKPKRMQGAFVSEKEVTAVTTFLREHGEPSYEAEVVERRHNRTTSIAGEYDINAEEEDLKRATEVVVKAKRASATLLQSRMRVGFAKASRILDLLEERGIIGPQNSSKPREVLIDEDELDSYIGGGGSETESTNDDVNDTEDEEPTDEQTAQ